MRTVTVTAQRGTTAWVLECSEASAVGQCRRLSQADAEMREAIAHQLGLGVDEFEIHLDVALTAESLELVARVAELRHQAAAAAAEASEVQRAAARALAAQQLSMRDIGEVMGLSFQRVSQLLDEAASAERVEAQSASAAKYGTAGGEIRALDRAVRAVAAKMPEPVEVVAQMGATSVVQILLGRQWGPDDPADWAGIDPEDAHTPSHWWVDLGGGEQTAISGYGPDADPAVVAQWISTTYKELRDVRP